MANITRRGFIIAAAVLLAGCGSGSESKESDSVAAVSVADSVSSQADIASQLDFDGTGMTEAGDFTFYITSSGGTSEGGNVPKIVYKPGTMGVGVDVYVEGGDGTVCTVYIDGMKRAMMNAGHEQKVIQFEEQDTTEGLHKVELVSDDGGASIYRVAQYEIVIDN